MNSKRNFVLSFCTLIILLSSLTQSVAASVRVKEGDLPFYARIGFGEYYHTEEWAVIVFYRPPACIPEDFNLLEFFDIPRVFNCGPYTTDGFGIWKTGPGIDPAPIQVKLFGLGAVPVWFVNWPALEEAMADGKLFMPELEAMPSLIIGYASDYQETLHPSGGRHPSMIEFVARGFLEDGRTFDVKATATDAGFLVTHIVFK